MQPWSTSYHDLMERDLCPRCGANWGCDCRLDALVMPLALGC